MESLSKRKNIRLVLLALLATIFLALAAIFLRHKGPPSTSDAASAPSARLAYAINQKSTIGIVDALRTACAQHIILRYSEASVDKLFQAASPNDLFHGIKILKQQCPTSPALTALLNTYLPSEITATDEPPAAAKLITDFPEITPPTQENKLDGATIVTAYKLPGRLTAVLKTYSINTKENFSSLDLFDNETQKPLPDTNSIRGFAPKNFINYPSTSSPPATYFLCQNLAGWYCAYWSTEYVSARAHHYLLSGGIFDNSADTTATSGQASDDGDTCQFRTQLSEIQSAAIRPIFLDDYRARCPGGVINAQSPASVNPLTLIDVDSLLRKLGPHPARANRIAELVNFKNPDPFDTQIRQRLLKSPTWAAAVKHEIAPPLLTILQNESISDVTQKIHDYLAAEIIYLKELQWALGSSAKLRPLEKQVTLQSAAIDKIAEGIPSDLAEKPFGASNYQTITFAVIRSQVEPGEDGLPRIVTYGTQGGRVLVIYSEKPLINGFYSPMITAHVIREGNTTVVMGNGNVIGAEAFNIAPTSEISGREFAEKLANKINSTYKNMAALNSCLSASIDSAGESGVDPDTINACQGEAE